MTENAAQMECEMEQNNTTTQKKRNNEKIDQLRRIYQCSLISEADFLIVAGTIGIWCEQ